MPIVNGTYVAPTWNNDAPPAINAAELQDICDTIETYNTSKADVSYVNTFVRPNLLDNAYFVGGGSQQGGGQFPINQRRQASYVGGNGVYCVDRWRAEAGQTNVLTVSLASDGINLVRSGNATYPALMQTVENASKFAGQNITVSCLVKQSSAMTNTLAVKNSETGGGTAFLTTTFSTSLSDWTLISATGTVPAGTEYLHVFLYCGVNGTYSSTLKVAAIKLELGNTQTLAHKENGVWVLNAVPNFQQELARCQRFFQNLNLANNAYTAFGIATATNGTKENVLVNLCVPLRTTPAISTVGTLVLQNGTTSYIVTSVSVDVFSGDRLKISCTSSGLTAGETYQMQVSGSGTIMLSADL